MDTSRQELEFPGVEWLLTLLAVEGENPVAKRSTNVVRRGDDRRWRYAISLCLADNAYVRQAPMVSD